MRTKAISRPHFGTAILPVIGTVIGADIGAVTGATIGSFGGLVLGAIKGNEGCAEAESRIRNYRETI
jgi:uncharacterized membrane protein